ncbi:adhesin, partial [Clostridium butyricum]
MKLKKQFKQILCVLAVLIVFSNIIGASSDSFPKELKINVSKNDIYQVEYVDFDISSRKMNIKGRDEVAYCLE